MNLQNILTDKTESKAIQTGHKKDLRAPLVIGLQTIGEHKLLQKQPTHMCGQMQEKKRPLVLKSPKGLLKRKEPGLHSTATCAAEPPVTVGETTADAKNGARHARTPDKLIADSQREAEAPTRLGLEDGVELNVLQVGLKDFFGAGDDSEDEAIEFPPSNEHRRPTAL